MPKLDFYISEDIEGVYDSSLPNEIFENYSGDISDSATVNLTVVQNDYIFDPTLGEYGGYRINVEISER